jgi:hypothetical protein
MQNALKYKLAYMTIRRTHIQQDNGEMNLQLTVREVLYMVPPWISSKEEIRETGRKFCWPGGMGGGERELESDFGRCNK